jgi:HEAT repeat protein
MEDPLATTEPVGTPSDLPAVEPPSAGFIVQLFLIPALIVAVVVTVYLLFGKIAGGHRSPEEYLSDLRGSNEERRWLAAHELALILQHDKAWQQDDAFAREIARDLEAALSNPKPDDKVVSYQHYLARAVGFFRSPVAIDALRQALADDVDKNVREAAVWSIGRLGDTLRSSDDPSAVQQLAAAIPDLAKAGDTDDAALRKLVTFTLGSLGRPEAVGHLRPFLNDSDREVCYNAAAGLARLGSTLGLETLLEMLDIDHVRRRLSSASLDPNQIEAHVQAIQLAAIESISRLSELCPTAQLKAVQGPVENSSKSGSQLVRTRAAELLIKLNGRS